jgi:hypothetical protein
MSDDPERLVVKPVDDRLVRHPRTFRPIHPDGQDVTADRGYFHRMLRAGDVVRVSEADAPRPGPTKKGDR